LTQSHWKPDLYVISRFLEALWLKHKNYKKTNLQMAVKLNYDVYMKYVSWLEEKGLITTYMENEHQYVKITTKGVEVYNTVVKWMKETIGQ
jgi:predicted transcriptional regulator